jgi:hypothetical protein
VGHLVSAHAPLEVVETYQGTAISFRKDGWINATQMAKPFGMRPAEFLRLPATISFIKALAKDLDEIWENPTFNKLQKNLVITNRGVMGGTWMHPDLALEFARWLSPEFALWCNRTIRAILAAPARPLDPREDGFTRLLRAHMQLMERMDNFVEELAPILQAALRPARPYRRRTVPRPALPGADSEQARVCRLVDEAITAHAKPGEHTASVKGRQICDVAYRLGGYEVWIGPHTGFQRTSRFMRNLQSYFLRPLDDGGGGRTYRIEPVRKARHRYYVLTRLTRKEVLAR